MADFFFFGDIDGPGTGVPEGPNATSATFFIPIYS